MARLTGLSLADLDQLIAWFEDAVVRALRSVARAAADLLGSTLGRVHPSAVSPEDLGVIRVRWLADLDTDVLPALGTVWQRAAGAVAAGLPEPVDLAAPDAAAFLAAARNRLVGVGDHLWESARDQLAEGTRAGEGIDELAARVASAADVSEARARVIARTEVVAAHNAASLAQVRVLGDPTVVKEWLAVPGPVDGCDEDTRPTHCHANGQRVRIGEPFKVGGAHLDFPGDPSGPPEEVINERCSMAFDLSDEPLAAAGYREVEHPRGGGGKWREKLHDKLNLGGRIRLDPGEELLGSDRLRTEDGSVVPIATTRTPTGARRIRLGTGIATEDERRWSGANRGSTVVLDEAGAQRLHDVAGQMAAAARQHHDRWQEADGRWQDAHRRERDLTHRQYPDLTPDEAAELDALDEHLPDLDSQIASNDQRRQRYVADLPPDAQAEYARIGTDIEQAQADRQAALEAFWATPDRNPRSPEFKAYRDLDRKVLDLYDGRRAVVYGRSVAEVREMDALQARGYASLSADERRRLQELQTSPAGGGDIGRRHDRDNKRIDDLIGEREQARARRDDLTAHAVALSAEDAAALDAAVVDRTAAQGDLDALSEVTISQGAIPAGWGDLAFEVTSNEMGGTYRRIAVRRFGAPDDWSIGVDSTESSLSPEELDRLAKLLDGALNAEPAHMSPEAAPVTAAFREPQDPPAAADTEGMLRVWFTTGDGADAIRWGTGGDRERCERVLSRYGGDPATRCADYQDFLGIADVAPGPVTASGEHATDVGPVPAITDGVTLAASNVEVDQWDDGTYTIGWDATQIRLTDAEADQVVDALNTVRGAVGGKKADVTVETGRGGSVDISRGDGDDVILKIAAAKVTLPDDDAYDLGYQFALWLDRAGFYDRKAPDTTAVTP
jgi:hypothetical protein